MKKISKVEWNKKFRKVKKPLLDRFSNTAKVVSRTNYGAG